MADWQPPDEDRQRAQQAQSAAAAPAWTPPAQDRQRAQDAQGTWLGGLWAGVKHGLTAPFYSGAQIGARMGPEEGGAAFADPAELAARQQTVDKAVADREKAYREDPAIKAHPYWATAGDISGQIAATSPLMALPGGEAGTALRLGRAALQGGLAAAAEPVVTDRGDFWSRKAKQVGWGAAGGAAGETVLGAAGRIIAPKVSPEVKELARRNVQMTVGQLGAGGGRFGSFVRGTEEKLKSFPILGDFIQAGERRSIEDFNRAVINQALEPIGTKLPAGAAVGREAVGFAQQALDDAYDQLLPGLRFRADQTFTDGINNLRSLMTGMPRGQKAQFEEVLRERLIKRLGPTGTMDGQTLKQVESELKQFAGDYSRSSDAAQRQLGTAVKQLQAELRQSLERQNPQAASQLGNVNAAYAMLTRVERAANQRVTSGGVFRPVDLLQAIRSQDPTVRHRAFAAGDAMMQTFAEMGQKVLPGTVPNSGTPDRLALMYMAQKLITALGTGAAAHAAGADLMTAGAAAAMAPLASDPARRAFQRYMVSGPGREAVGTAIGDIGSYIDPAFGIIAGRQAGQ